MAVTDGRDDLLVVDPDWMLFPIVFRALVGALLLMFAGASVAVATGTGVAAGLVLATLVILSRAVIVPSCLTLK